MDNPFFTALEGDGFTASDLASKTRSVLTPFIHYLNNSIKALENKEVSCEWKSIADKRYRLTPQKRIYRLVPVSEIEIISGEEGWYEILCESDETPLDESFLPDLADPVIVGKGADRQKFPLEEDHYKATNELFRIYLPELSGQDIIQWSGYQLKVRPLSAPLNNLTDVHIDSRACKVVSINGRCIRLQGYVSSQSGLSIYGKNTRFRLISSLDKAQIDTFSPCEEGNGWLLFSSKKPVIEPHHVSDVTAVCLQKLTLEHFILNGQLLSHDQWSCVTDKDSLTLEARETSETINKENANVECIRYPALRFGLSEDKIKDKWIQLIEPDSGDDTGKSVLDYFFGDNIKVLDHTEGKFAEGFRVLKSRPDERQILLARNKRSPNQQSVYPSTEQNRRVIRVSVDTSQLKKQKDAINQLMSRPSTGHKSLIHLLQERKKTHWPDPKPYADVEWQVLTNLDFDGCDRQRDFVAKALTSPDFSILDGPPGTGKTTTILELIVQLVLQGKRVLLSASTHAAINNVLERVDENSVLSDAIFPLRIGDENNAIGVEHFQFDKLHQELKKESGCDDFSLQLMVDASNLVCGTTIGILRLFNNRNVTLDRGEPPFDVMIIDECSKTTFQEFLVPARFAKRWVLVGDVRQLSPFTDREQIVANLDNLMLVPPRGKEPAQTLPHSLQQACFLLEELRGNPEEPYQQPMLVSVSSSVLKAIGDEVSARIGSNSLSQGLDKLLLVQSRSKKNQKICRCIDLITLTQEPWHLYGCTLCFVDENAMEKIQQYIPDDMLVVHGGWQRTDHAFIHKGGGESSVKSFRVKAIAHTVTGMISENLLERFEESKWSEEVCWRLEREYWLRLSKNQNKARFYTKTLERLFPQSVNATGRIHVLKNIAFPSVLEALSGDGLVKRKNDDPTTLNQGFTVHEKAQRHSTLSYQHRMHPDISVFPREQFYSKGVLKDGRQTRSDRQWSFTRYETRNVWLDVQGKINKNVNLAEVTEIIQELKAFCDWAEGKSKNAKGDLFDVAVLTFYKGQEKALRDAMQKKLPGNNRRYARFSYKGISIKLATVDYFQGQEADLVFLSMVNTARDGFMDSPNRLNVSITRARYQLVVVGCHDYFSKRSRTVELKGLANSCCVNKAKRSAGGHARRNNKR
ncbi:AAA domain-containing protein [Amphritea sp. 2_MG-2023]|uniref:AAA domain-containing protein n=1 Tax=Amphritea TaxID=515417 RepID=UPI001C069032|nr:MULTISPECIES: AAA domain-containing protein [Amphritea]MBU2964033.1 AAA family ATPase [Amphritea atlantica]MDO6418433.1 AAA domain-containing protein [Amphritea sp. 2_MG-2023]